MNFSLKSGTAFLVVNGERVLAELLAVPPSGGQPRPFGLCAGQFSVPPDFDAPLPDEVLREFEPQIPVRGGYCDDCEICYGAPRNSKP